MAKEVFSRIPTFYVKCLALSMLYDWVMIFRWDVRPSAVQMHRSDSIEGTDYIANDYIALSS